MLYACCDYLELFSCLPFFSHLHDRFMIAMWRTWSLYLWSGLFSAALPSLVMILTMTHPHIRAYLSRLFICCNTFEAWFWWGWWWVGGGLLPGRDFLVTSCWDRKWGRGVRRLAGAGCFYPYNHQSTYCTTCNAEILLFGSESITICMRYLWMEKYLYISQVLVLTQSTADVLCPVDP